MDKSKRVRTEQKNLIPFLDEPYEEEAPDMSKDVESKTSKILELETENSELKAVVEEMKEEMEKIKNEMLEGLSGNKTMQTGEKKRISLELERAKLKEKESENIIKIVNQEKMKQEELAQKYKEEMLNKENNIQTLQQSVDNLQSKFVMMKAERDKLIDISNELRIELNILKKQQMPQQKELKKNPHSKLEKLKQDYQKLDSINE